MIENNAIILVESNSYNYKKRFVIDKIISLSTHNAMI